MKFADRIKNAWNAFRFDESSNYQQLGYGSSRDPGTIRLTPSRERSLTASIFTRLSLDVASIQFLHAKVDENRKFQSKIFSGLGNCLTIAANKDQTGIAFIQDIVMGLCEDGIVGILPVDVDENPDIGGFRDILSMRPAEIKMWYPDAVRVSAYNDRTGLRQEIVVPKDRIAIVKNPFWEVMNEPNSTLRRLSEKLAILDAIDVQSGSGKLDIIVQLPYVIKTEARREQANKRRLDVEDQLSGSKYGIAYIDGTERVTQLNRPAENNLMAQVEYLTAMLYSQLGITKNIFDGTASPDEITNYQNSTVRPIAAAIASAMDMKFISRTARTQGQAIVGIRDPFTLVSLDKIGEIADSFTRNEILSPNDVRAALGMGPSGDPDSNKLRNRNISSPPPKEELINPDEEVYE